MSRLTSFAVALILGCGSPTPPSQPPKWTGASGVVTPEDHTTNPACTAGNWVPGSQEPPEYIACTADVDCAKMVISGCCSAAYVAIRRDHACGSDMGSTCDMICEESNVRPKGAEHMHAACVATKCTLVR